MESVLNTEISLFKDYNTSDNPQTVTMLDWLNSKKYKEKVLKIRTIEDKKRRNELKATLPACTPSGTFAYRSEANLVKHSGLIQFDIDEKGNEGISNYSELKREVSHLDYVAYVGLSVSGKGIWGLVPLAYPERHKEQFAALEKDFAGWGIALDDKPKNVSSLRGYSWDAEPYFNHKAVPYEKCYEEPKIERVPLPKEYYSLPVDNPFQVAANTLERQGIFYENGNRHEYLWQFARLCNRFGISREDCAAYVDTVHGYDEKTNWLESYRRYASEYGQYDQPLPSSTKAAATLPPTVTNAKPSLPPGHKLESFINRLTGRTVTNEINQHGYPAFWDN